ncbi:MAG TPA: hypothetical protein PLI95_20840 [Polyangiaceae bacterium]|nr:hypothetical protein [Polyangiaceae bacterium]
MATTSSAAKRMKERAREEKRREKEAKKAVRKQERSQQEPRAQGDEDPDIAGIVPGPQPIAEE